MIKIAVHRVILEQVRERPCICEIVNRYKVDVGVAERRAQDITADAAKSIDTNLDCHSLVSLLICLIVPQRLRGLKAGRQYALSSLPWRRRFPRLNIPESGP